MTTLHEDVVLVICQVLKYLSRKQNDPRLSCNKLSISMQQLSSCSILLLHFSGVLKDYLRELPYPLITKQLYEAVLESMATRPLRIGASGCENDQADTEHTVGLLENLPEVERVRKTSRAVTGAAVRGIIAAEIMTVVTIMLQITTVELVLRTSGDISGGVQTASLDKCYFHWHLTVFRLMMNDKMKTKV